MAALALDMSRGMRRGGVLVSRLTVVNRAPGHCLLEAKKKKQCKRSKMLESHLCSGALQELRLLRSQLRQGSRASHPGQRARSCKRTRRRASDFFIT